MPDTPDPYLKLSLKLLELFSRQGERCYAFERYWALVGPVGTFSEQAAGEVEQRVAKGLQDALERLLRDTAPRSFNIHAEAVSILLGRSNAYTAPSVKKPPKEVMDGKAGKQHGINKKETGA